MRRLFQFGLLLYVDTYTRSKRDKILIRNTTQRHLDNQENNDVDAKINNLL